MLTNTATCKPDSTGGSDIDEILQRLNGLVSEESGAVPRARPVQSSPPDTKACGRQADVRTSPIGQETGDREEPFIPLAPKSLQVAGLGETLVESLIMRFLLQRGEATGRGIAEQIKLPFLLIEPILNRLKAEQMTAYRGANSVNDYTQPKDLVDDAFLRRIPYKIEVENPSEAAFRKLFEIMCPRAGLPYQADVIEYLINTHYKPNGRPFRNCHPRDLLLQVRNYCLYHDYPMELKNEYIDFACENYFSIM